MRKHFLLLTLSTMFIACFKSPFESECGDDIRLGGFELSDTTKAYLPYTGSETLVFEDSLENSYKLTSSEGLVEVNITLDVHELCRGPFFNIQHEYYDGEWKRISFQDSTGFDVFDFGIITYSSDQNDYAKDTIFHLDSIAIYEMFSLSANELGTGTMGLNIITVERQGQLPDYVKADNQLEYRVVGDTVINGKQLKDVISAKRNGSEMYVLYNKEKGLVAFKPEQDGFWVLKE